jgi:hypothetical protein
MKNIEWKKNWKTPAVFITAVVVTLFCLHVIFGCTTASAAAVKSDIGANVLPEAGVQGPIPSGDTMVNWKNRGFGEQEPVWLIKALNGDISLLKTRYPASSSRNIVFVRAEGANLDRTENIADAYPITQKHPELKSLSLLDSTWFMIHQSEDKTAEKKQADYYVSVRIYTTDSSEPTGSAVFAAD